MGVGAGPRAPQGWGIRGWVGAGRGRRGGVVQEPRRAEGLRDRSGADPGGGEGVRAGTRPAG